MKNLRARIIELVEDELCLWDHMCASFNIRDHRDNAWERVFQTLKDEGFSVELGEVKTIWAGLQDRWRRRRDRKGTGSPELSYWPYENALKFLEDTEYTWHTMSNIDEQGNFRESLDTPPGSGLAAERTTSPVSLSSTSYSGNGVFHSIRHQRRKGKSDDDSEALELIRRAATRVEAAASGMARKEDKYDHFGRYLACALRESNEDLAANKLEAINSILLAKGPVSAAFLVGDNTPSVTRMRADGEFRVEMLVND
ncbi:hypothetical protein V3C99_004706 [Haemonchus contortus]